MKRVWKISDAAHAELFLHRCSAKPKTLASPLFSNFTKPSSRRFIKEFSSQSSSHQQSYTNVICLFSDKWKYPDFSAREEMRNKVSQLRDELLQVVDDDEFHSVLEQNGCNLFRSYPDGSALVELLKQLDSVPILALEVFEWKRKNVASSIPMTALEYTKGIRIASRNKNVELAAELFRESTNKGLKSTSIYNSLMAAFMYNGFSEKCRSVFRSLKEDATCRPTIVTYNILLSVYGRLMMVDKMEAVLKEVYESDISPNLYTYNNLIAGYITAWMWDKMESTYDEMLGNGVKPDLSTHLLVLRGYAHSNKLEKMENIYDLVKHHVDTNEIPLIRAMICAYSRSKDSKRVDKIEALSRLIPENEYRPWLNVLLIKVYAQEDLMDGLESKINEAFARNTCVTTAGVMRCIIASYFRKNSLDNLENFVKRAEYAGWVICRSLYHCRMVMYATHNRLNDMEKVIDEMGNLNFEPTKKTFWIMFKAYSLWGHRYKVEWVLGLMCKHGYGIPDNITVPS